MIKNILKIFTGTLVSRIFGYLRELSVAFFFGTSKIADAFAFALMFPNIFRQVLGEDMVERAFMPPFKTIHDKNEINKSWRFLSIILNRFFFALLIITGVLYFLIPLLFSARETFPSVFGFIFSSNEFDYDLALKLILIMLPFMIFIGFAAFVGSMLNFFEKNWIFGFAPVMLSIGVILGIVFLKPFIGGYSIAVGYLIGAFLQFVIQLPFIFSKKFRKETGIKYHLIYKKEKDLENELETVGKESKIIATNAVFNKSSEIVGRFIAATLSTGATSSLFFANRLFQLPFAIFSLPIVRGINPVLNKIKNSNDYAGFDSIFKKGQNLYIMIFIPVVTIMIISSYEIVNIVMRYGKFDLNSLNMTAKALMVYSLALLPMSFVGYYTRILSLFNKNKYSLIVSIIGSVVNIVVALTIINTTNLGHLGIAFATAASFLVNMFMLRHYLKKELHQYIKKSKNDYIYFITMGLVASLLVYINYRFELYFFETKIASITSLMAKSLLVFMLFFCITIINPAKRKIILGFLRK